MEDGCAVTRSTCSCWEATIDCDFLHHNFVIFCVKPHYFCSAFRSAFLHSGFHSCPCFKGGPPLNKLHHLIFDNKMKRFIGASLSEPHTSVTALHTFVCIYACLLACLDRPLTVNFEWAHSNISQKSISWSTWRPGESYCQSAADPERRRLKLKHVWRWFVLVPTTASHSQAVQI